MPLGCKECGYEYEITPHDVLSHRGCPNCHRACTSFFEQFIYHTCIYLLGETKVTSMDRIAIGYELDIYIPELKVAIEPGSWYWHKNLVIRDREKQILCKEKGIRLVTLYDHYDDSGVPFDDCFVTPCALTARRNMDKLIELTGCILAEFGLDSDLGVHEWDEIKKCAQKDSKRMTTKDFKKELAGISDKIVIIGDFTGANDRLRAQCKTCNHEWQVTPTSLRAGSGCPKCAGRLKITHNQFVERLNLLQPNMMVLSEYIDSDIKITITCKVCSYIWSTRPYHLTGISARTGCPKCSNRARSTHDDFVEEIARLSPVLKIMGTYVNRKTPLWVQCGGCSKIWQPHPGSLLKGSSCKNCKSKKAILRRSRKVRCIITGEIFNTLREAAAKYNISSSAICMCCHKNPKRKHAGGREWEYIVLSSGGQ